MGGNGLKSIFFEALPWKGKPTRVFAWLGLPPSRVAKYPGIVLVHGGSGTVFKTHQVSNLQAPGRDLVTLHIYTPPLKALKTFSIMGDGLMTDWIGNGAGWLPDETKVSLPPEAPCLSDEQFEKVVRFMHANLKHDIHLADFAKQTGHTLAHFSVPFKSRTGCSPFHYLKELRLREAHRLFVAGIRDVKKVAVSVGYTHCGYFCDVFKAYWKYSARNLIARVRRTAIDHR